MMIADLIAGFPVAGSGRLATTTDVAADAVWGYVMANGQTAEQNVLAILALLNSGELDVNIRSVNGVVVQGTGEPGNSMRPA